jgi:hypothetical protein
MSLKTDLNRMTVIAVLFAAVVFPSCAKAAPEGRSVPPGTIIPVRLDHGFSDKTHPGSAISGRVMQIVPLPNAEAIPAGATVHGTITSIQPGLHGGSPSISFSFTEVEVHHQKFPISVELRALASSMQISLAQIPDVSSNYGTPSAWADTVQIGGDTVYGAGGDVTDQHNQKIGKALLGGGVLVHLKAQSGTSCGADLGDPDRLQALWVFSGDACGVYGLEGVRIARDGRTDPIGVISLESASEKVKLGGGAGMLLRTID